VPQSFPVVSAGGFVAEVLLEVAKANGYAPNPASAKSIADLLNLFLARFTVGHDGVMSIDLNDFNGLTASPSPGG